MKTPTPIFSKRSRSRLGLSGAVVALILVVIGIAVTLIVGSVVGGMIGGWARREGIMIERAEANVVGPPTSNNVCVLVVVKNIGSSPVSGLYAEARGLSGQFQLNPPPGSPSAIQPGQTASFTGCSVAGTRGEMISIHVTGTIPGGSVGDRRSVPIT
jgi:phage tail tape-measure protein